MTKELESSVTNATCVCFKSRECSEKIHYEYLLDRMERTLYNAISEMKRNNEVNKLVCQTKGQKDLWGKRLKRFTLNEMGALCWNGQRVPTVEELTTILWPFHETEKRHIQDEESLRKVLSDKGYVLPTFIGGLERAVKT